MIRTFLMTTILATPVAADPLVMTDIAPVHSLVAAVMGDVGAPDVLISGIASPHHYDMRPSDARKVAQADLIIWTGPALTPWLADPITSLASGAAQLVLLDTEGWSPRTGGAHDHGDHEEHGEHDDHADHDDHDDHADHDDHDDHATDGIDPHAWLDPVVAQVWLGEIASALATADPANADIYRANAAAEIMALDALMTQTQAVLAKVAGRSYLTAHDALGYFEDRFDMPAAGHLSDTDDAAPGPAHISGLRAQLVDDGITCLLVEPGPDTSLADILSEGTAISVSEVDPTGMLLTPGPALYRDLITAMAQNLADCLS